MQCYRTAVLASTIAACCCLLLPLATAGDSGSWVSPTQSREPARILTRPTQPEANRQSEPNPQLDSTRLYEPRSQRGNTLPENNVQQYSPVTAANYQEPQPPTTAVEQVSHSEPTRIPWPKTNATGSKAKTASSSSSWKSLVSAASGLIFVIAIFVGLAFLARKAWQPTAGSLPKQVFEVLGRSSYAPRQQVVLMRFGNKVLLVNHEQGNVQTLSEIEAEEEVERIMAACQQNSTSSLSANFSNVLSQVIHGKGDRSANKRSFLSKALPSPQARRVV